jgi:predicted Zn finger-like uncharacterized protein
MILTCPECATSYFVDDSRIPGTGRTVKCTSCGARWKAHREGAEAEVAPEPPLQEAAPETPEPDDVAPDDLDIVAVEATPEPEIEPEPQPPVASPPEVEAKGKVAVWAAAAALVVALVTGAIVFRGPVVRLWPASEVAYAGLGLPVNSMGLVIEGVRAEPTFLGGRPVLSVTGAIRNVRDEAVTAPALRINLLNRAGKPVAAKVLRPLDARVPAGATRRFAIAISDPPANARDLEVMFEVASKRAAGPSGIAPLAPVPGEAHPLPAGTPDALPEHG